MTIELKGITWNHSRAFPPLVATAQRYEELHPGLRIRWDKRTLHEFGHAPIDQLANRYDLIVIDHPWAGFCFSRRLTLDLKPLLDATQQAEFKRNYIGNSSSSYDYEGQWLALPIDAAAPTPSYRPDLMEQHALHLPRTWSDVVTLADAGHAVMPGFSADLFLNWSMLVAALEGAAYTQPDTICDSAVGLEAIDMLCRLAERMSREIYEWNPIAIAERMTTSDEIAFCCFAYSYNNYCRPTYTTKRIRYGDLPVLDDSTPLHSIIGGTGIALSRSCRNREIALDYARFAASSAIQQGIYTLAGGQPAHRHAWSQPAIQSTCAQFFDDARKAQEQAIIRPRYDGYVPLQEKGGVTLQHCLRGEVSKTTTWRKLNELYRESRAGRKSERVAPSA